MLRLAHHAPHAARAVVAASVVVTAVAFTPTDVALLLLVAGGAAVPLVLRLPHVLDTLYVVALLVAGWSSVLDLYETVTGWDLVVHVLATGVIAVVAYDAVVRLAVVPAPEDATTTAQRIGVVVVTAGLGSLLGIAWEIGEWWGNAYLDPTIGVGYEDTVSDLAAGAFGSALAAVVMLAVARRRRAGRAGSARPTGPTGAARPS